MTNRSPDEEAVVFRCAGEELCGIFHPGARDGAARGVVVVVGGPQYRIGSHRQFVHLARHLAAVGYPVMRFDYRGMGDSGGDFRDFSDVEEDIRAAVDAFVERFPDVSEVVLWGLCDAASAGAFHAFQDRRIGGLVLVNPWVRTESGEARARVRHYYLARLASREFWAKVMTLRWRPLQSLRHLGRAVARSLSSAVDREQTSDWRSKPLPDRMLHGLERFPGRALVILSGQDLTAREFEDVVGRSPGWQAWAARQQVDWQRLPEADHTFSRRCWTDRVSSMTAEWMGSW